MLKKIRSTFLASILLFSQITPVIAQEDDYDNQEPQEIETVEISEVESENLNAFDNAPASNSNNISEEAKAFDSNLENANEVTYLFFEEVDSVVYAEDAIEFAGTVAQMSDDPDTKIIVATDADITEIISDAEYTAVQYDEVYVIDFDSIADKNMAVDELSTAIGEENISGNIEFTLDEEDDEPEYTDEVETVIVEEEPETVEVQQQEEETPKNNTEQIIIEEETPLVPASTLYLRAQEEDKAIVALIDTGVSLGLADEYVDLTNSDSVYDQNGHGTKMAMIIKDEAPNDVLILSIKAFDASGCSSSAIMYAAIKYAMEAGADAINISASANDSQDSAAFKSVLMQAMSVGIKVIASAGNAHKDAYDRIPVNIDGVIGVTSLLEDDKTITGGYGRYVDFGVIADSTSVATAMVTGYMCADVLKDHIGIDVFELNEDGSEAVNPVDEESFWITDCASVLFVRAAIQQPDMTYIAGSYTTVTGKSGGGALATYRVYGATPDWWEDGNTHKAAGGINSGGRTWFYMDNEGSGGYDTNSPEFDHIAASRPYYGNSQYSIYHSWAAGKILGNFQIDQINVSNSLYSYVGYHIEYYNDDSRLGTSHSNTEAQAKALAETSNAFFYENAYNTGNPDMTYGTPTSLKTGAVYASFSRSASAGGHASQNSTNFRYNNSWRRIHVTLVFNLNKTPRTLKINYLLEGTTTAVATAHESTRVEGDNYSIASPTVSGYTLLPNSEQPEVISGKFPDAVTVTGTMPDEDVTLNVYYEPLYKLTVNYLEEGTSNVVATKHESSRIAGATYSVTSPNVTGYRLSSSAQAVISGTQPAQDVVVNVYYKKTNLELTKAWIGDITPTSVNLVITKSDGTVYQTVTLNASESWKKTINVDYGSCYYIYETGLNTNDYTSTCTQTNKCIISSSETESSTTILRKATVTNRKINDITVAKEWKDEDGYTDDRPSSVTVHLINNTTKEELDTCVLNPGNNWRYNFKYTDLDLASITYGVYEELPDFYDCEHFDAASALDVVLVDGKLSSGTATLSNEYTPTFPKDKDVYLWDGTYPTDATGQIDTKTVNVGDELLYRIYFTNPARISKKFDIEDTLPTNTTYVAGSATDGGVLDGNTVKWSNITVQPLSTKMVYFRVTTDEIPKLIYDIHNTASVWMLRSSGARITNAVLDPVSGIEAPYTHNRMNLVMRSRWDPELGAVLTKRVTDLNNVDINTKYVQKGDILYYHLDLQYPLVNPALSVQKTFIVTDTIPANTEYIANSAGYNSTITGDVSYASNMITWTVDLDQLQSTELVFKVRVTEDMAEIPNFGMLYVDSAMLRSNTVNNQAGKIVINKNLVNTYDDYGERAFIYRITGSDDSIAYRSIQENGSATFEIPRGTAATTTFTVKEERNARYIFDSLATTTDDTTTITGQEANVVLIKDHRLSNVNYTNKIQNWDKLTHADETINAIRK